MTNRKTVFPSRKFMNLGIEKDLHIRESTQGARNVVNNPRLKPAPTLGKQKIPMPFSYIPSNDGTDENLLILIHGLGELPLKAW